ncbi:hypothetical protein QBC47DRAFT_59111 [Echria macrotheca]|uniref:Tyrosinase copper-binding domain-containing protein n=1 Tax=Echria macrotheca TaxID=438768 RepID=A0AAJ0F2M0_9PEZI|nr:hypothetical protein QBC47DRAFT_59111 [Echria macrotheca]
MAAATIALIFFFGFLQVPVLARYGFYDYGFDISQHVKRQIDQPFVVMGRPGDVQMRQEIRQLEQDKEQWTLYILGLSMLQFTDQSSPMSWYGLTGIHGIPHKTWGGVGPTPGNEKTGYCTHSSVLFPTWHRPYLVLYEQVLYGLVQSIAALWPEGDAKVKYKAAAEKFRIPYWDWASTPPSGQSVLPASVGEQPYIDIDGPSGMQRIANPLFAYTFTPLNATEFLQRPWNTWTSTLRSPTTNDNTAQSNNSLVARNLDQNLASISQRLYILFSNYANYTLFSNNAWIPLVSNQSYDSLESLHDTIHNLAGGGGLGQPNVQGGHMSYIPYSAFDPIFFLHHANVDRIFAIWQTLNPKSWVLPQAAVLSSYTTSRGEIQNSTTALTPFYAGSDGTFWTSDSVRDHTKFGYTYAELSGGAKAGSKARRQVMKAINRLYGHSSPTRLFRDAGKSQSATDSRPGGSGTASAEKDTESALAGTMFAGGHYREWIANIRVAKQALNEPFAIYLFSGSPPQDPREWPTSQSSFGMMGVFASDNADGMSADQLDVSGTIPLTGRLTEMVMSGQLASLEPRDVEGYLKSNLQRWVLGVSGRVYNTAGLRSLKVEVVSSSVRAPITDEELPEWGKARVHFELK